MSRLRNDEAHDCQPSSCTSAHNSLQVQRECLYSSPSEPATPNINRHSLFYCSSVLHWGDGCSKEVFIFLFIFFYLSVLEGQIGFHFAGISTGGSVSDLWKEMTWCRYVINPAGWHWWHFRWVGKVYLTSKCTRRDAAAVAGDSINLATAHCGCLPPCLADCLLLLF